MEVMDAVVLAGGNSGEKIKEYEGVVNEAFIPVGSRFMVDYVINALEKSLPGQIVVVGPVEKLRENYGNRDKLVLVPGGDTVIKSVLNGLEVLNADKYVLIVSGDIPLITPAALTNFISSCFKNGEADLYYPIIEKNVSEKKYPEAERTFIRFVEGVYTGGNIFLIRPNIVEPCAETAEKLINLRKSPVGLCRVIGISFIIKFFLGRLSIAEAEEKFSSLLELKGTAVKCEYPEIGMDIDKDSDLEVVEQVLESY